MRNSTKLAPKSYTHCVSKKYTPWCLIINLANVDQFSKFFHQLIHRKILYVYSTIQRFPPHLQCCYTTLWNSKIQKCCQMFTLNMTNNIKLKFYARSCLTLPQKYQTIYSNTYTSFWCIHREFSYKLLTLWKNFDNRSIAIAKVIIKTQAAYFFCITV